MPIIAFDQAVENLDCGNVVAIPTETVYGLAANGFSDESVAKIYALKNRPQFNPLIMHIPNIEMISDWAEITPFTHQLMQEFWYKRKASISFVLNLKEKHPLSLLALAGLNTVAVRRPNHHIALELLNSLAFPLAAPSANRSNNLSPTSAEHVFSSLSIDVPLLDGGECSVGLESTIADLTQDKIVILRKGAVTEADLKAFGEVTTANGNAAIRAPGMLKRHYAPNLPLKMNVNEKEPGMAILGFGNCNDSDLNLSPNANLEEAAANLFKYLHNLDCAKFSSIGVSPIPNHGIGEAINDRLQRAMQK